uniref:Yl1-domain-containing protein n=1 Tax=Melanopsichium pennsylvanicum 4 TaxID=1398559 RepID=A0A077RE33_9BASI|nr:yl1-domain-containing protein [Melanopsichium pennsylvanicum 4]
MSRSSCHASSSAGPSPSEYPESAAPSTYRIERFDSAPSSDLMVTSRAKRSTAGNRLKALLDQELEKDEIFAEVENDAEFEADETNAVDIVDSDFDRESDDDALAVEDESEGEREIEAQEKAEKSRRRAAARVVGIVKRPTASIATPTLPKTLRRPAPSATGEEDAGTPQAKRRRISFAPDQPDASSRSSPIARPSGDSARRSSARSATVQSKREVESRLEEASQRRASQPIKAASKKKQSLTQDALIAEALEVEEENRESLRRFLEQEEERRAKQRMRKERITGPFVRWISVGMRTRVADEVKQADTATEETVWTGSFGEETSQPGRASLTTVEANATANKSEAQTANTEQTSRSGPVLDQKSGSHSVVAQQQVEQTQSGSTIDPHQEVMDVSTPPPPQLHLKSQAEESTTASSTGDAEVARSDLSAQAEIFTTSSADPVATPYKMTEPHTANLPKQSDEISAPASLSAATAFTANRTSAISAQAPVSAASLTLDPAISARQEATAIRTASKPSIATSSSSGPSSATSSFKFEKQARTLLCVENAPEDWEWLDEYNAIFGDHCQWDAYPYVPSRNRPVKPRQSICPITGLPALYRDPPTSD